MSMFEKQEAAKQAQSPAFKARSEEIRMHLELSQEITRRLGADRPPPGEEGYDDDAAELQKTLKAKLDKMKKIAAQRARAAEAETAE